MLYTVVHDGHVICSLLGGWPLLLVKTRKYSTILVNWTRFSVSFLSVPRGGDIYKRKKKEENLSHVNEEFLACFSPISIHVHSILFRSSVECYRKWFSVGLLCSCFVWGLRELGGEMSSSLEQVFIRFHVKQNKNLRLTIMVATSPSLFPSLPVHTSKKRKRKKKHYTQTNYIIIIIMIIYIRT